jgi:serine kinase of HPr protein (carbohydrate metabolism regulator)
MTPTRLHATTVAIGGRGVMIVGPSGAGKSDLALRLIDRGATLVSDDYTEFASVDGAIVATPPATIAGRIEVHGLGIVDMPHLANVPVAMLVDLAATGDRMPEPRHESVIGIALPAIGLPAFEASTPIKVEIALARLVKG